MTAAIDTNLLLYASDRASALNGKALQTLEDIAAGPELTYLFWPVALGYLRIATHPGIFRSPLSPDEARSNVQDLMARPHLRTGGEKDDFWEAYALVANGVTVRGNLVPDAHIAALMRQYGVTTIWSHDRDFRKFDGITIRDPFG